LQDYPSGRICFAGFCAGGGGGGGPRGGGGRGQKPKKPTPKKNCGFFLVGVHRAQGGGGKKTGAIPRGALSSLQKNEFFQRGGKKKKPGGKQKPGFAPWEFKGGGEHPGAARQKKILGGGGGRVFFPVWGPTPPLLVCFPCLPFFWRPPKKPAPRGPMGPPLPFSRPQIFGISLPFPEKIQNPPRPTVSAERKNPGGEEKMGHQRGGPVAPRFCFFWGGGEKKNRAREGIFPFPGFFFFFFFQLCLSKKKKKKFFWRGVLWGLPFEKKKKNKKKFVFLVGCFSPPGRGPGPGGGGGGPPSAVDGGARRIKFLNKKKIWLFPKPGAWAKKQAFPDGGPGGPTARAGFCCRGGVSFFQQSKKKKPEPRLGAAGRPRGVLGGKGGADSPHKHFLRPPPPPPPFRGATVFFFQRGAHPIQGGTGGRGQGGLFGSGPKIFRWNSGKKKWTGKKKRFPPGPSQKKIRIRGERQPFSGKRGFFFFLFFFSSCYRAAPELGEDGFPPAGKKKKKTLLLLFPLAPRLVNFFPPQTSALRPPGGDRADPGGAEAVLKTLPAQRFGTGGEGGGGPVPDLGILFVGATGNHTKPETSQPKKFFSPRVPGNRIRVFSALYKGRGSGAFSSSAFPQGGGTKDGFFEIGGGPFCFGKKGGQPNHFPRADVGAFAGGPGRGGEKKDFKPLFFFLL